MGDAAAVKKLKDQLELAVAKDRNKDAVDLLARLERLEPDNARWSHRLGDVQRRLGQAVLAVQAYERAVQRYEKSGFLPRAIAMAKTILTLDATRTDVLASIQQEDAQSMRGRVLHHSSAQRSEARNAQPQKLTAAIDAASDEVRFADAEPLIELDVPILDVEALVSLVPPPPDGGPGLESEADRTAERVALLPFFALFSDVPRAALLGLASASELVEAEPGSTVIRRGDPADAMFGIISGSVRVLAPAFEGESPPRLGEGEIFGEACLLTDEPRHADVVVEEQLTALRIPKHTLDTLVVQHEEVGHVLINLLTVRLLGLLMRTSPLFSALDPETQREVIGLFEIRTASEGTVVQQAGKRGDGLYIPLTGKLEISRPSGLTFIEPAGTIVGQSTLLGRTASPNTVRTLGDTVMLRLPSTRFIELVTQYPTVLAQLSELQLDQA